MATPFLPLDSTLSLEEPSDNVTAPAGVLVWNANQACDSQGWSSTSPDLALRPTAFSDKRLQFLNAVEGRSAPPEFVDVVAGQYDVRTWRKDDMILSIEGEKTVYLKVPTIATVVSWTSPERLPILTKSWRPVVFLLSPCNVAVRYTPDAVLYLTRSATDSTSWNVTPVSYSGGFCSVDPCSDRVIVYGSFAVPGAVDTIVLPPQPGSFKSDYFIQYHKWGFLIVPKQVDVQNGGLCGRGNSKIATVVHPPHMFISVDLVLPAKVSKTLQYEKDFAITAKKTSESDIVIYLILDGQLVAFDYSFDIRINKPEKPHAFLSAKIKTRFSEEEQAKIKKAKAEKKPYSPRISFVESDLQKVVVTEGSPLCQGHLLSEQVAAIYDANSGMYYSNPVGLKLTKLFKQLVTPKPNASAAKAASGAATSSLPAEKKPEEAAPAKIAASPPAAAEPKGPAPPAAPAAAAESPAAVAESPAAAAESPAAAAESPAAAAEAPAAAVEAPAAAAEAPAAAAEASAAAATEAPAATTEAPAAPTQAEGADASASAAPKADPAAEQKAAAEPAAENSA